MKHGMKVLSIVAVMLAWGAWSLAQQAPQESPNQQQALPNQQVQDPGQPKRPMIKATGTPQQAIPTQTSSNELPDEQQATKEQIEELLDVMRVEDQMNDMLGMLPAILEQQHTMNKSYEAQLATLSAGQRAQVDALNKKYQEKAQSLFSVSEMMDDLSKLYQNHLNSNDVESLITFYSSDAAQHLLDAQPEIMKEYIPLMTARITKKSEELHAEHKKDLDALMASFKAGAGKN
jgi:hypothetical protein